MEYTHDNALWARLCGVGSVAYVSEPLYGYRVHGTNRSQNARAARKTVDEFVQLVDAGFEHLPEGSVKHDRFLRWRARQAALAGVPTMLIGGGHRSAGWRALWYAATKYPVEALLQPRLLSLLATSAIGPGQYNRLRVRARRLLRRLRPRPAA
jgi:hypothetical protein